MTRREFLKFALVGMTSAAVGAGGTALVPKGAQDVPTDPLAPRSGIIDTYSSYSPGGPGGPLYLAGHNGAGTRWTATIRAWDAGAQLTYGGRAETPDQVIRLISMWQTQVTWWPLPELDGAALRADFAEVGSVLGEAVVPRK